MKIILISSDSRVLLEEKIDMIIKESPNIIKYNALESNMDDILQEASYVSLFSEEKYIVVKNANYFGKEKISDKDSEKLLSYLSHPYENTTLIFTTYETIDKRKSITKYIIENYKVIEIKSPKNYELQTETKKKLTNYAMDDKTIKYIVDACLGNYDLVMNEISKLRDYFKTGTKITLEMSKEIIASNVDDNVFKFVDSVIKKDLKSSLKFLEEYLSLKGDVLQLINMLLREYRLIMYYLILREQKNAQDEILRKLKLQEWQLKKIIQEANNYHLEDIKDYILKLGEMDYQIKSGGQDKNLALQAFLIDIMEF